MIRQGPQKDVVKICENKCSACPNCVGFQLKRSSGRDGVNYSCAFSSAASPSEVTPYEKPSWQEDENWSFYVNSRLAQLKPVIINGWTSLPRVALQSSFDSKSLDAKRSQSAGPVSDLQVCISMCQADPQCAGTSWRALGETHPDYQSVSSSQKMVVPIRSSNFLFSACLWRRQARLVDLSHGIAMKMSAQKPVHSAALPVNSTCEQAIMQRQRSGSTWTFNGNRAECVLSAAKTLTTAASKSSTGGIRHN